MILLPVWRRVLAVLFLGIVFASLAGNAWAISPSLPVVPTATPSAVVTQMPNRLTEPQSQPTRNKLEAILRSQRLAPLGPANFLRYLIRTAVRSGVSPNTIILIFLLPLVGALVGILQYFVGLSGFGMFMPAMLAVTFLATGISGGLFLFAAIVLVNNLVGRLLRPVHLHYWPRRAIALTFTSLATFFVLLAAPFLGINELTQVSIFPVLFFILLAEEFTRTQLGKSRRTATSLTLATIILAILGDILMNWSLLQRLVLLNPEVSFLTVLVFNVLIGRYSGFRLLEYRRFYSIFHKH